MKNGKVQHENQPNNDNEIKTPASEAERTEAIQLDHDYSNYLIVTNNSTIYLILLNVRKL